MKQNEPKHLPYLPHTESDREAMLAQIGVRSFDELISHIPKELRVKELNLPDGLSELELTETLSKLAAKNRTAASQACFLGGGSYRRFVPAMVPAIVSRAEFATAYTPYQPEVSQGSLQAIYEFQSSICLITGMEVANASMYDGPTACAEAALMACRLTNRQKILFSKTINPEYSSVTETYAKACNLDIQPVASKDGLTEVGSISIDSDVAAVIVQYPNYYGCIEDLSAIAKKAHEHGALLVVISEPISLGLLTPPAEMGADIVIGDAQPCGNFLSYGGPSAGYMACRQEFVRQLPGRLAGKTVDIDGRTAYTLTLQTREQHIRRAKATSNICTNQALNALSMLVYLTAVGPDGLKQIANLSCERAHYLAEALTQIPGVKLAFAAPFMNEFVVTTPKSPALILKALLKRDILGGIDLTQGPSAVPNGILVAVTEMNSRSELDHYATSLKELLEDDSLKSSVQEIDIITMSHFDKASSAVK